MTNENQNIIGKNEEKFKEWMPKQKKPKSDKTYSPSTCTDYAKAISYLTKDFSAKMSPYKSIFDIDDFQEFIKIFSKLENDADFNALNLDPPSHGINVRNYTFSAALKKYREFLASKKLPPPTDVQIISNDIPRNLIFFGAPGTGKSYDLNNLKDVLLGGNNDEEMKDYYERVTFHPDYSYANFVGTYKPKPDGRHRITYKYVPGPFMRLLVKAMKNRESGNIKPFLLIIEEINRANVAAVFGDVFQLLDRKDGVSEYPVQTSEDIREFLADSKVLGGNPNDYKELKIPDNMFIWATMNSADQGVFPMDTAFKRRWAFRYIGINNGEDDIEGKTVILGENNYKREVEWNKLRKAINNFLMRNDVNEDKQLGAHFITIKIVATGSNQIDAADFIETFKNKVLMYLFEDAAKHKRKKLFAKQSTRYSEICDDFDKKGIEVFSKEIVDEIDAGTGTMES